MLATQSQVAALITSSRHQAHTAALRHRHRHHPPNSLSSNTARTATRSNGLHHQHNHQQHKQQQRPGRGALCVECGARPRGVNTTLRWTRHRRQQQHPHQNAASEAAADRYCAHGKQQWEQCTPGAFPCVRTAQRIPGVSLIGAHWLRGVISGHVLLVSERDEVGCSCHTDNGTCACTAHGVSPHDPIATPIHAPTPLNHSHSPTPPPTHLPCPILMHFNRRVPATMPPWPGV